MGLKYVGKSEVVREWTDKEGARHRTMRALAVPIEHSVPLRDIEDGEMAGFGGKAYLLKTGLWAEDEPATPPKAEK